MSMLMKETDIDLQPDDLRELMRSVAQTSERLEATHAALQKQVAKLQRELAEANAQLRRSQSLAALGEMAAGIAHEIRNPLGSIQLYVQVLSEELRGQPELEKICEKIDRAVIGMDAIVRDVLSFARNTTVYPRSTTALEVFDSALAACEALIVEADVVVERRVDRDCSFEADFGLFTQAVGNVFRNAIEAMRLDKKQDRRLRVEASERSVRCPSGETDGRIVIVVEDSGPGIPQEIIKRMFNPFFTTREAGTGLGLAIVHRIVDAHGGHINVARASIGGARFEICLPPRFTQTRAEENGRDQEHNP